MAGPEVQLLELLSQPAHGAAVALLTPHGRALSYDALHAEVRELAGQLTARGCTRGDRIAIVLGNGPEMAAAFLGVAAVAIAAPLNPAYTEDEFRFFLEDLQAKALLTSPGLAGAAERAAQKLGLPVWSSAALEREGPAGPTGWPPATGEEIALLLHTSGTTARPKIVPLRHGQLVRNARNIAASLELAPTDRCLNIMPLFHVHGLVGALLSSFAAGASVICAPRFSAAEFFGWAAEFHPTWYTAVPAMHQALLAEWGRTASQPQSSFRFIRSCSAALPPRLQQELEDAFGSPVIEAYGMTEGAHQVATNPLPPGRRKPGSVGRGTGVEIAVLSAAGNFLEPGRNGEIVLRGATLLHGYAAAPEINRAAFADGWFRTGDEGRIDAEGYVFLNGRSKEIINRGGEKISPREIDEVLLDHPAVAQAVAFGVPDPQLGEEVAAAVVARSDVSPAELRDFVAARLASFKVPAAIRMVSEIPKGPTGKVQRRLLASLLGLADGIRGATRPLFVPPQTAEEKLLAKSWGEVLERNDVGVDDHFRDLGGNSLDLARVAGRLRLAFGLEPPLEELLRHPVLRVQADWLAQFRRAQDRAPREALPPFARSNSASPQHLSFAQEGIWIAEQLGAPLATFHRPLFLRLDGPLDVKALEHSLNSIVERHEVLRTAIRAQDGMPRATVGKFHPLSLVIEDFRGPDVSAAEAKLACRAKEFAREPFQLGDGEMLHCLLLQMAGEAHVLLLCPHHLAFDAWSARVFCRELFTGYAGAVIGRRAEVPPLALQYGDYAAWQRRSVAGSDEAEHLKYWREELGGDLPMLALPFAREPRGQGEARSASVPIAVPAELRDALGELCQREGATMFLVLFATYLALLQRYTGETDFIVGSLTAGRSHPDLEPLIGCFVNQLPIRVQVSPDAAFATLLGRVREKVFAALRHEALPFERLLETLPLSRRPETRPIFQTLFNFHNLPSWPLNQGGLRAKVWDAEPPPALFDFSLHLREEAGRIDGYLLYDAEVYERADIERLAASFLTLLRGVALDAAKPVGRLEILPPAERARILSEWNRTSPTRPVRRCLHSAFEEQAARAPDSIAIVAGPRQVTYGELNARANTLARSLRERGAGPGVLVGLCVERSATLLVGVLGILKSGGAFVPLDPRYPAERLSFILSDTAAPLIVTQDGLAVDVAPEACTRVSLPRDADWEPLADPRSENPGSRATPQDLCYVTYTSGSTGRPKGVEIRHHGSATLIDWACHAFSPEETARMLFSTSICFDLSIFEIFLPLQQGGTLIVAENLLQLPSLPAANSVTFINTVPSAMHELLRQNAVPASVRSIGIGGEALLPDLVDALYRCPQIERVYDLFGPTETSTYSIWALRTAGGPNTIGRPIDHTRTYVLDGFGQPVPIGVVGELYIGGEGVARGYHRRPELTAERFVADPFSSDPDARLYRTGDRVRYRADGALEYLGRFDHQVKIRGYRVEPGETEVLLRSHPGVTDAVVVARPLPDGTERFLAGYLVARPGSAVTVPELREFLRASLPDYLVPTAFVFLEALPLSPNGKVNRLALPAPSLVPSETGRMSPRTATEEWLARAWATELQLEQVGVQDDFFALGGHSLLAARIIARVRREFSVDLPLRTMFTHPTVETLAREIASIAPTQKRGVEVVQIQKGAADVSLVLVSAGSWAVRLAHLLGPGRTVLEVEQPWLASWHQAAAAGRTAGLPTIPRLAQDYAAALKPRLNGSRLVLGGFSFAGLIAFEVAHQLRSLGTEIEAVFLIDAWAKQPSPRAIAWHRWRREGRNRAGAGIRSTLRFLREIAAIERRRVRSFRDRPDPGFTGFFDETGEPITWRSANHLYTRARESFLPRPLQARGCLFRAEAGPLHDLHALDESLGWRDLFTRGLEIVPLPGGHAMIEEEAHKFELARQIKTALERLGQDR